MVYPAIPREAASLVIVNSDGDEVLWAKRNNNLKFLGGFHSFPGGKVEEDDSRVPVRGSDNEEEKRLIACGVRETFEEVGLLLVRNGDRLTKGQLPLLHDDLVSGREKFADILDHWGLWVSADDFHYAGQWITPEFSPVRFKTSFFTVVCPSKQKPYAAITELEDVEFVKPEKAIDKWKIGEALMAPPVLAALRTFSGSAEDFAGDFKAKSEYFVSRTPTLELTPRILQIPLRTKTLPPATHTNCFIVGKKKFVVIDAASPFEEEQKKLISVVDEMIADGGEVVSIIVSHLHPDHFGGETVLKGHLLNKHGMDIPIHGHPLTIDALEGQVKFDATNKNTYTLKDSRGEFELQVLHTPGHAKGHLCFYDEEHGFLLSSDNVVGAGTVVIAPPEGNMTDYLKSLSSMRDLPGLRSLAGSHGAGVKDARGRIETYIKHRLEREEQILEVYNSGATTVSQITSVVYSELDERLVPLAEKSVEAHLEKLITEERIEPTTFETSP